MSDGDIAMLRIELEAQRREALFWQLFEVGRGTQSTILLALVFMGLTGYLAGVYTEIGSPEWIMSLFGIFILVGSGFGYAGHFIIRREFVLNELAVGQFMATLPDRRAFEKHLRTFVAAVPKNRKLLETALSLDRAQRFMWRHLVWMLPALAITLVLLRGWAPHLTSRVAHWLGL